MIIHEEGYVYNFNFYLVFVTKYRRKIFDTQEKVNTMKAILQRQATISEVTVSQLEVMPDHVHMFIEFDPRLMLHKVVKQFKGKSSHILREEFPFLKSSMPSLWTRSYFSCSVGHISEDSIKKYIESQQKRIK